MDASPAPDRPVDLAAYDVPWERSEGGLLSSAAATLFSSVVDAPAFFGRFPDDAPWRPAAPYGAALCLPGALLVGARGYLEAAPGEDFAGLVGAAASGTLAMLGWLASGALLAAGLARRGDPRRGAARAYVYASGPTLLLGFGAMAGLLLALRVLPAALLGLGVLLRFGVLGAFLLGLGAQVRGGYLYARARGRPSAHAFGFAVGPPLLSWTLGCCWLTWLSLPAR